MAVQRGDTESFEILVERYEAKMLRYARKFLFGYADAEDLVQEVFMKAYANLQGFDTGRKFSAWLYRVAHNQFINAIKKRGREPLWFFDPDTLFPHPTVSQPADYEIDPERTKVLLERCLAGLDPKYREPLVLYYYEEMGYQKIAEVMHVPVSTVGIRLKRGRRILAKLWANLK